MSYLRFEPVDPPALVHRHRVSEGESLERLVLRSNYNADPKAYLSTPKFKAAIQLPASADFEYVALNQRHVVPPKSSQLQCEQHGLFDKAFGGDRRRPSRRPTRWRRARPATCTTSCPAPTSSWSRRPAWPAQALTTTVPPALPSPAEPAGGRLVGGQYVVHREERLTTPYLPDGAAGGFALRGDGREDMARIGITQPMVLGDGAFVIRVPQTEELVLIVQNGKDWPDTQGLRIVIDERAHTLTDGPCTETFPDDGRPKWDPAKRVLTIFLRKGHIARLRYSSFVDKRYIDALGLPRWSNTDAQRNFIAVHGLLGVHWMITPYRALVLVHATQQPVCTPVLQKVSAPRSAGQTFTDLDGGVRLHGPSTGKFEVVAEWDEWFDDPQQPRPLRKADARHARRDPADREPRQRLHAGQRRQRGAGGAGHRPDRHRRQAHARQPARVRRHQVPPGALPHRGDDALSRIPAGGAVRAARPDHAAGPAGAGNEGAARRRRRPRHRGALRRGRRHAQRHARAQHAGARGAARGVRGAHLPLVAATSGRTSSNKAARASATACASTWSGPGTARATANCWAWCCWATAAPSTASPRR